MSVVQVSATGVQPQSYKSGGSDSAKATIDLKYDWQSLRLTGSYEGTAVDLPLTPQTQDDGSVQLALMVELLAGRTPVQLLPHRQEQRARVPVQARGRGHAEDAAGRCRHGHLPGTEEILTAHHALLVRA